MESSRDSSIWRSLAVAFGDGLAFGVGVKLTQNAGRQAAAPTLSPRTEDKSLVNRLGDLERRLARMEQAPAAVAAPAQVQAQFDQKVLEAVVNALEARLKEHAGHVERRLAELEAKITIELKALDRRENALDQRLTVLSRDQSELPKSVGELEARLDERTSLIHQVEQHLNGLEDRFDGLRAELVEILPKAVDERGQTLLKQMEDLVNAVEDRMVAMHHELAAGIESRGAELSREATATAMAAVDSVLDPKLAEIRATLAERNAEIAALRGLLDESDGRALELLLSIGEACRNAAEKLNRAAPAEAPSKAPTSPPPAPASEETPAKPPEPPLPGFAQPKPPNRILKLPLVSSMVISVGLGGIVLLMRLL